MSQPAPSQRIDGLQHAVLAAMPGWHFSRPPEPFTWAPQMHLRAELTDGSLRTSVVLRRSWSEESHRVELFLYESVLPHLALRTARLLAVVRAVDGSPWLVFEDLGSQKADPADPNHRRQFLHALGVLHGTPWRNQADWPAGDTLPRFPRLRFPYDQWRALLADPPTGVDPRMGPWLAEMLDRVLTALGRLPYALLHGDPDFSNAVSCQGVLGLIDWEYACIGPAALDLARPGESMRDPEELDSYRAGFRRSASLDISPAEARRWMHLGQAHECLRWVAHYLGRLESGQPRDAQWRARYFDPAMTRLLHLRDAPSEAL